MPLLIAHSLVLKYNNIPHYVYYTPAIVWGILILYFSLLPHQFVPTSLITVSDLLLHALIYGVLTFLLFWARFFSNQRQRPPFRKLAIDLILILAGSGLVEIIQEQFIEGRSGEFLDLLANFVGALLGTVIALIGASRFAQ
jgi:VanZ family protein